ncbi:MAG: ribosome recycling factor [bacterium]
MPDDIVSGRRSNFDRAVEHLKTELASLRTGRANAAMVENVQVEAYGSRTALVGLASITVPDAHTVQIEPWDKSVVKDVERGIIEANLGFNPVVAGSIIRVIIPPMTEEVRLKMKKLLGERLEQGRISVRQIREEIRSDIKADESVTEDDRYRLLEDLDKVAAQYNDRIREIGEEKEKEIMTI